MDEKIVIKKLIVGAKGLGWRPDGMAVMASGVLPGETIRLRSGRARKGYLEAREINILEPAPERIAPPCPYCQEGCGGCDLQHASYAAQLACKKDMLTECLQRAGLDLAETETADMLPSPQPFGYRHRLRLHLDNAGQLGFFQHGRRQLIPIQHCLLATGPINQALRVLRESGWPERWRARISQVELLHSPADDRIFLLPHLKSNSSAAADGQLLVDLQGIAEGRFHALPIRTNQIGRKQNKEQASQNLLQQDLFCSQTQKKYQLRWDASCFFQANALQSPHLVDLACKLMSSAPAPATVLELFCGMGAFSVPLGLAGMAVTGLEHNRQSLFFAEANCHAAGLAHCRFHAEAVGAGLNHLLEQGEQFEALLFDPPRQGLGKDADLLSGLSPRRIVAVSCDPATLARDLRILTGQGFRLRSVHGVDMFPQTHHIESLALLERN